MKRLTMSQVAKASLKANRKAYLSLAIGIFLAVYLASAMIQGIDATVLANEKKLVSRVGWADAILLNADEAVTDEKIRSSGLFAQAGKVFVSARIGDTGLYAGYYDEAAAAILPRTPLEGRLPEKSGEIALEQSAVEQLRQDLHVGDSVTFLMNPLDGVPEERTYTLVGVLGEQAVYMEGRGSFSVSQGTSEWPNALLWPEDAPFQVGSPAVHRVFVYGPLTNFFRAERFLRPYTAGFFAVNRVRGEVWWTDPALDELQERMAQSMVWWVLGGALLLACGIGISSAMESVLAQKTEEIGMLRAVGATRRQIRRLFGRDAWLLVLIALPVGIALGLMTVWLFSRLIPDSVAFSLNLRLLLPVAALSALCVFLSSRLPLRRAGRMMPVGVLRDTAMLKKARKFKSKACFRAPRLIAGRQIRLHPLRQAGGAVMVTLTLLCTVLLCEGMLFYTPRGPRTDFEIQPAGGGWGGVESGLFFAQAQVPGNRLTAQDAEQLRAIPQVQSAQLKTTADAALLFSEETVPRYFRDYYVSTWEWKLAGESSVSYDFHSAVGTWGESMGYLLEDTQDRAVDLPEAYLNKNRALFEEMQSALTAWNLAGKLVNLPVCVSDLSDPVCREALSAGTIDLAAIDAGRQVAVYAPDECYWTYERNGETIVRSGPESELSDYPGATVLGGVKNDYFVPGKAITVVQALDPEISQTGTRILSGQSQKGDVQGAYAALRPTVCPVTVGAVMEVLPEESGVYASGACLLTTEKGLRALGLQPTAPTIVGIRLREGVEEAEEDAIQRQLERIAMRGGLEAVNRRAASRQQRQLQIRTELVFLGVVILFFAVSVAMQIGAVSRRIRADTRMIGTLRAVGADEKALLGCYRLPLVASAAAGLVLAVLLYLALVVMNVVMFISGSYHPAVLLPVMAALSALCALCCVAGVKARLRQVLNKSVVENIREL